MIEFLMPSLGADMEAGTLVEWLKHPGDRISRGDVIAVVETEKGAIEIEVFEDAVVEKLLVEPGAKVPVGAPLAILAGAGEQARPRPPAPGKPAVAPGPRPAAPPVPLPTGSGGRILASPAARRLAGERGVDLAGLTGSGPQGAVVSTDVDRALRSTPRRPRAGPDLAAMRRAIAASMARSKREIPHYYLATAINMSTAITWLGERNAVRVPAERLLPSVLILKAVALALKTAPQLNGFHVDGEFRPSARVHVGAAIAIRGGGLIAPAIHDTAERSLDDLMKALRDLVARVRSGGLRSSELSDSTITVTNLGDRGVEQVFGVIQPPQVAIVGFGRIAERPWSENGKVVSRPVVEATLAADHRVSDGHLGAGFLAELGRLLQEPGRL